MGAEIEVERPFPGAAVPGPPPPDGARRWTRPDWFELLVLAAFAAVSMWVVALDLYRASVHGLVWTGTDGFYIVDQMQYLAWIQEAAKHVLVANLFVLHPTTADYFQPAVVISGVLTALGMPDWLALLLWKPVAVVVTFFGVRAYARESLDGTWARRVALVLGLFFGSITIIYGSAGVLGDLWPTFVSWGYTFGLLAIGLMLFSLIVYGHVRDRAERRSRWLIWVPGLFGAVASLLHPWQGELIILIVLGAEATLWWLDRRRPSITLPAITVIVTGAALLYYEALGRTDPSWKLARDASKHSFSLATILLAIVPLLIPALLAFPQRPRSFLAAATRLWPVAALAIYVLSASAVSATPLHSFEGITVPLAILAIEGVRRLPLKRLPGWPVLAVAAVLAATVPAMVSELATAKTSVAPEPGNANFITQDEHAALRYLAKDPQPGGVLSRFYLGTIVPAETGRRTFVGDCLWSEPNCPARAQITQMIFDEEVPAATSRWLVQQIGARFVLADCTTRPDMASVLAPITESVHRFGCAAVYTLR
jgi:hypothetical protein